MDITAANLDALRTTLSTAFRGGLERAPFQVNQIATVIRSTSGSNTYGMLGMLPKFREWIGDRVVNRLKEHSYSITNKKFELTFAVDADDIADDNLGQYAAIAESGGEEDAYFPIDMIVKAVKAGKSEKCYDGKAFFSKTHKSGKNDSTTTPNLDDSGDAANHYWYVIDNTRALKPFIFQDRENTGLIARDAADSDNVFNKGEFQYGAKRRGNFGYGLWQQAYASNADLTEDALESVRVAMRTIKNENGDALRIRPSLLIVPPQLEKVAKEILTVDRKSGGAGNVMQGTMDILAIEDLG